MADTVTPKLGLIKPEVNASRNNWGGKLNGNFDTIDNLLPSSSYTAADVLTKLKTVDGAGSGLDADFLDGNDGTFYTNYNNITNKPTTFPPTLPIAQSDVTNLVSDQSAQNTAIAAKVPEAPSDGITYGRKNSAWVASIGGATIADVPPGPPLVQGQLFWESDTGALYVWYNDGTSSQWVMVSGTGSSQQTDYVRKTGDTMTGALTVNSPVRVRPINAADTLAVLEFDDETGVAQGHLFWGRAADNIVLQSVTDAGAMSASLTLQGDTPAAILAAASGGTIYLRPNTTTAGQTSIDNAGNMVAGGNVQTGSGYFLSGINATVIANNSAGNIFLRPNGFSDTTGQCQLNATNFHVLGPYGTNVNGASFSAGLLNISGSGTTAQGRMQFANGNGAVGSITTNASATAFNTTSDERRKDFIGPYDPQKAIAIIRADPVRDFTWIVDGSYAVGWGAQTSYAISQDLASPPPEDDPEQPWGMDQAKRTPYLWAALAWALDRIDDMEARLAALEAR